MMKTYDYPAGGTASPFDAELDWQYFIYARGFSHLADDPALFADLQTISAAIPTGYKSLLIVERRWLIQNGDLRKKRVFPARPDGPLQGIFRELDSRFVVCHDFEDQLLHHYGYENCVVFSSEKEAQRQANLIARLNPTLSVVMGRLIKSEFWH